jgi:hypothetical protein
MSTRRKRTTLSDKDIPLSRLARPSEISSYVKKLINASLYDFYESEAFEVKEVILNDSVNHGAVMGTFIDSPNQPILGDVVLPLMPHITNIPLIGEHVVVTEYNRQHYYTSIINRKNSPNENSQPGASGIYEKDTKYGDTFERKDIRRVEVNEGDIVYEGRFGNSIKLGSDPTNGSPVIKIRAGQTLDTETRDIFQKPVKESIDNDASSIYLISSGSIGETFEEEQITGKKILIKSDGIFISGRDNLKFKAVNNINVNTPVLDIIADDIKLGSIETTELQPVVKGDELKSFLDDLLTQLNTVATAMTTINPAGGSALTTAVAALKLTLASNAILSTKVKTI